ncbi:hypothetical protein CMK11_06960 [Candidatus Poribacteria bacterium]|nr:hypothetical protein [Candidatus Poribacteria bacterium]
MVVTSTGSPQIVLSSRIRSAVRSLSRRMSARTTPPKASSPAAKATFCAVFENPNATSDGTANIIASATTVRDLRIEA